MTKFKSSLANSQLPQKKSLSISALLQADDWLIYAHPELRCFARFGVSVALPMNVTVPSNSIRNNEHNKSPSDEYSDALIKAKGRSILRYYANRFGERIHGLKARFLPLLPPIVHLSFKTATYCSSYLVGGDFLSAGQPEECDPFIALLAMVVRKETAPLNSGKNVVAPSSADFAAGSQQQETMSDVTRLMDDLISQLKHEVDAKAKKEKGDEAWNRACFQPAPWGTLKRSVLYSDSIQFSIGVYGGSSKTNKSATLRSSTRLSQLWEDLLCIDTHKDWARKQSKHHDLFSMEGMNGRKTQRGEATRKRRKTVRRRVFAADSVMTFKHPTRTSIGLTRVEKNLGIPIPRTTRRDPVNGVQSPASKQQQRSQQRNDDDQFPIRHGRYSAHEQVG